MYEERRKGFSIRDIILQILLIVLFVFIMVWLFPTKNYLKENNVIVDEALYTNYITNMTEAAKDYFTVERMPKEVGQTSKLTLKEMLNNKLILEIGGNASCDVERSFVEVTKMDTDYQLRVELSCTDYSNYVIVTIGCKNFCTNDNDVAQTTKPTTKPTVTPSEKEDPKPVVQVTKYTVTFDTNGGSLISSQTVEEGKLATKPANPTKEGYTFVEWTLNGKTYDFNTAVNSDITLVAKWEVAKVDVTLYQYSKEVTTQSNYFTDWSKWSDTKTYWGSTKLPYSNTDVKEYTVISTGTAETGEVNKTCTTEKVQETVVVDTQAVVKESKESPAFIRLDSEYSWATVEEIDSEVPLREFYKGETMSTEAEADTRYVFVTTRVESDCDCNTCTNKIIYVYKKMALVENVVTLYSCPSGYTPLGKDENTKCVKIEISCAKYGKAYKLEDGQCVKYGEETKEVENCTEEPIKKAYVKYQVRTREEKTENKVSYVYEWSENSNDKALIEKGYKATGETKIK